VRFAARGFDAGRFGHNEFEAALVGRTPDRRRGKERIGEAVEVKARMFVIAVCAALVFVPSALAAGNTSLQKPATYNGPGGNVQQQVQEGVAGAAGQTAQVGKLPFTGQDLAVLVVGGFVLLVVGAGFRRLTRSSGGSDA
jgi:hypothetical protein